MKFLAEQINQGLGSVLRALQDFYYKIRKTSTLMYPSNCVQRKQKRGLTDRYSVSPSGELKSCCLLPFTKYMLFQKEKKKILKHGESVAFIKVECFY